MHRLPLVLGACMVALIVGASFAVGPAPEPASGGQGFLKIPGIPGESTDAQHADEIVVLGFSFGESREFVPTAGGAGFSHAQFSSLTVQTRFDRATPTLVTRGASGETIPSLDLSLRRADGFEFLKVHLDNAVVSSLNVTGTGDNGTADPLVTVGFGFQRIAFDYVLQTAEGTAGQTVHGGWDVVQDRAV